MFSKLMDTRKKLAVYKDIFYYIYLVSMALLASTGFDSGDMIYKVIFLLGAALWAVKMVLTDYNLKEILVVFVIFLLLGIVLLHNGERTLIITALAVTGAKDVDIKKALGLSVTAKIFGTILLNAVACFDLVDNILITNKKNGVVTKNYSLGYTCPNHAFLNLFMICLLLLAVFQEKMKWYGYLILTAVMYGAYKAFYCRTGFYSWLLLMMVILIYRLLKNEKHKVAFTKLLCIAPGFFTVFTIGTIALYPRKIGIITKLDRLLNYRISMLVRRLQIMPTNFVGADRRRPADNGYFHILYNYGLILAAVLLVLMTYGIYKLAKEKQGYEAIILFISCVYLYMEFASMSTVWNVCLILVAKVIYDDRNKERKEAVR